jgi:lipoprotein-releasing system ATP-binding protein
MQGLSVQDITKQFPTRGDPLVVLRGVSLSLAPGENLAILGPSGSGKTTLLTIIGTLDNPTSGHVQLNGINPFALNEPDLAAFRNRQIGFVFQDHHLLPQCSALENVLLPTIAAGPASSDAVDEARLLLERVGLTNRLEHLPAELSGGERQRVAIARALVQGPALVLADEPTGNLDRTTARSVGQLLVELQRERNLMLIVVTHSDELARTLRRRVALDDGLLQGEE